MGAYRQFYLQAAPPPPPLVQPVAADGQIIGSPLHIVPVSLPPTPNQ